MNAVSNFQGDMVESDKEDCSASSCFYWSSRLAFLAFRGNCALDSPGIVAGLSFFHMLCPLPSLHRRHSLKVPEFLRVSSMHRARNGCSVGGWKRSLFSKWLTKLQAKDALQQSKKLTLRSLRNRWVVGSRPWREQKGYKLCDMDACLSMNRDA